MPARKSNGSEAKATLAKGVQVPARVSRVTKGKETAAQESAFDDALALSQLPVPFCCVTESGMILRKNESFDQMLGVKFQQPTEIFSYLEKEDAAKISHAFEFVVKWSQPSSLRIHFGTKKGIRRSFEARIQLMVTEKERLFSCVFWPVDESSSPEVGKSQLASLEKALAHKSSELAEQYTYFETFCYTASHDLRTPLRSIKGFAEALMEDYAASMNAEALDYLNRVTTSATQMDRMFEGILQLSRILRVRPEMQKVHVGVLLEQLVANNSEMITQKRASVEMFSCNASVKTDPTLLEKICQELVKNALSYTQQDIAPVLKISCHEKLQEKVLEIRFEDNGCGVPAHARDQIFIPFEKLHFGPEFNGVGMGLAIARAAAHKLGASILLAETDVSLRTGSLFILRLPH